MSTHSHRRILTLSLLTCIAPFVCFAGSLASFSAAASLYSTKVMTVMTSNDSENSEVRPTSSTSSSDPPLNSSSSGSLSVGGRSQQTRESGLQNVCNWDGENKVTCCGFIQKGQGVAVNLKFLNIRHVVIMVSACEYGFGSEAVKIPDLLSIFPRATSLTFLTASTRESTSEIKAEGTYGGTRSILSTFPTRNNIGSDNESAHGLWKWESLEDLSFRGNSIESGWIPDSLLQCFPNLKTLDMSHNKIASLEMLDETDMKRLRSIDISGNPLDCTRNFDWVIGTELIVNGDETLCEDPPHQNRGKPILKVYPLVKAVRDECRLNCSCVVEYVWKQRGGEVRSKNAVNCSNIGLHDFPDPNKMPRQTHTLYLNRNKIQSFGTFAGKEGYLRLGLRNLYLNDNNIVSIDPLIGSRWLSNFHILSLRNNRLTNVPTHVLENVMARNKGIHFMDLSSNPWICDCHTAHAFKHWLLRHGDRLKNVKEVLCSGSDEQVRQMQTEDWCDLDDGTGEAKLLHVLTLLALLAILTIYKLFFLYKKTSNANVFVTNISVISK